MFRILFTLILCFFSFTASAQHAEKLEPACGPVSSLPANTQMAPLFEDIRGGYWWVMIRKPDTGVIFIGYLRNNAIFCMTGEGKVDPQT